MRYSGEYNLLIFTLSLIYFDHHLELRIRKDMSRVLNMQRTLDKLRKDVELKDEKEKLAL
jgi:hypothetical protein